MPQTVAAIFEAKLEVKKSRFLAYLTPMDCFEVHLASVRALHPKANHHVTAFRRHLPGGRVDEGARDDGEPAGTSGMPILRVLMGRDLMDVGLTCVRYFGGIKLGAGGLARAYGGAAQLAIAAADLKPWYHLTQCQISVSFEESHKLERWVEQEASNGLEVASRRFDQQGAILNLRGPDHLIEQAKDLFGLKAETKAF